MFTNENRLKRLAIAFFAIIGLMFFAIAVRTVTRQVFIKRLGMNNAFTQFIFFDQSSLLADDKPDESEITEDEDSSKASDIKWYELYSFPDGTPLPDEMPLLDEDSKSTTFLGNLETRFDGIAENIEIYCTDYLPGYDTLVLAAKKYEQATQWNYVDYKEYNGVITLSDGYLSGVCKKIDVTASADATETLRDFCAEQGADFLYVQYPYKNCIYQDTNICGISDFSNQNADSFLLMLKERNIPFLDLRKTLHAEGMNHHAAFFRTDHHWTPETGLWAAQRMLECLNEQFDCGFNSSILDKENFEYVVYPKWFLGSQGKKVTLAEASPEDITVIRPFQKTSFLYSIPSKNILSEGDFTVTYDMDCIPDEIELTRNCYAAYNHGDQPLITIHNLESDKKLKILILHESFSNCIIPFLAMCTNEVDAIDLRHFNGSLRSYIEAEKPNIVIVAYNPTSLREEIDPVTHNNLFDFR